MNTQKNIKNNVEVNKNINEKGEEMKDQKYINNNEGTIEERETKEEILRKAEDARKRIARGEKPMTKIEFKKKMNYGMYEQDYLEKGEYYKYQGFVIIPGDEKAFQSKDEIDFFFYSL